MVVGYFHYIRTVVGNYQTTAAAKNCASVTQSAMRRSPKSVSIVLSRLLATIAFCGGFELGGLLISATSASAQSTPKGALMDIMSFDNDDSRICSFHLDKKKVQTVLRQADGSKLFGKPFWTKELVTKQLKKIARTIKGMSQSTDPKAKKKLKKAKQDRKDLLLARSQVIHCSTAQPNGGSHGQIRFAHVQKIIERSCMNCHGALGWTNTQSFFVDSGRIAPGDLEASPFYTFLANNPEGFQPGYMPKGQAPLAAVELLLLNHWVRDLPRQVPNTPGPTPTPDGVDPDARALYTTNCAPCHGPLATSAKWGRTAAQIRAALGEVAQMRGIRLTDAQVQKIADALGHVQPPQEGTLSVRALGPVAEGNTGDTPHAVQFEIVLTGAVSHPFTVGYVTSNGTALADSDYVFSAGRLDFAGTDGERKVVSVDVVPDNFEESDETLSLDIGGVSYGGVRITTSTANATIVNDDTYVAPNLPAQSNHVRMLYGFDGDYTDTLGFSPATPQGDVVISSAAKIGSGALELDEGADYVTLPGQNLSGITNFSLASWVYWENNTSITTRIFDLGNATSYIFFSPRVSSNRCHFEIRVNGTTFSLECNANVVLPSGRWVHLATTYDATSGTMSIYFDGQLMASRAGVSAPLPTIAFTDNRLGKSRTTGVDFRGRLDELMVWDVALSGPEVASIAAMTSSAAVPPEILVVYNGQPVANGATIDLGDVTTGDDLNVVFYAYSLSRAGLALSSDPKVRVLGRNSPEFSIRHQPWPWQSLLAQSSFAVFSLRFTPTSPGSKTSTVLVTNSDRRNGNFAIGISAHATGDALPEDPPPGQGSSTLEQGRFLYATNCSSCHGELANSRKSGATIERVTGALNPTTGIAQMRSLGLNADQISMIVEALNSPVPSIGPEKVENSLVSIGTAPYVASVLTDIFLPDDPGTYTANDTAILTIINQRVLGLNPNNTFIASRVKFFGGRCERFDTLCQAEALLSSQSPAPNTVRTGLIIDTCDDLMALTTNRPVENALAKIGKTLTSEVDPAGTSALYRLFHPGREIPGYLAHVIANMTRGKSDFTRVDEWRFQLHLFCTATDWEVR